MAFTRRQHSAQITPRDNYQEVTDRIIAALEEGVVPWRRPWNPALAGQNAMPSNATTGHFYRGINVLMLALSPFAWSTGDNRWCSYKQAAERGWQVRKGERGTTVFFFKKLERKDGEGTPELAADGSQRFIPMLRASTVFHASQMDGISEVATSGVQAVDWHRPEAVETILRNSGAVIHTGGARAGYSPSGDYIVLPPHEVFQSPDAWGATALHELAHWTGHGSRLDRDMTAKFGTPRYAEEELRAELASCFLGSTLGLPSDIPNHANYIADWLGKLRDDKREIFRAAAAAQRIADYCLGFHPDYGAAADEAQEPEPERAADDVKKLAA
ncbi:MAG: ArdC family protein [Janthinobacterium lividum]